MSTTAAAIVVTKNFSTFVTSTDNGSTQIHPHPPHSHPSHPTTTTAQPIKTVFVETENGGGEILSNSVVGIINSSVVCDNLKKDSIGDNYDIFHDLPPILSVDFLLTDAGLFSIYSFIKNFIGASGTSAVAIDNKIEQAMDLVKSHLMIAVREEVEVLKEKISELLDRINTLEVENTFLKAHVPQETLSQMQLQVQTTGNNGTTQQQTSVPQQQQQQQQQQIQSQTTTNNSVVPQANGPQQQQQQNHSDNM